MKKFSIFAIVVAFVAFFAYGCEQSEKSEDLDYKKACESKDFSKAYEIVDKLKEITSEYKTRGSYYITEYEEAKKKSDEAERYVILQETMYVLESQGSDGLMRIVGIAKEHDAGEWLYPDMIDVAIGANSPDYVKFFANLLTANVGDEYLERMATYLFSKGSQEDIDFTLSLFEKINKGSGVLQFANRHLTVEKDNVTLANKLVAVLESAESKIPNKPRMGKMWLEDYNYKTNVCDPYSIEVKKYNDQCLLLLNLAIKSKNQTLAKKALGKVKSNINSIKGDTKWTGNDYLYYYDVSADNDAIKSANAIYQEAVRNGVFN